MSIVNTSVYAMHHRFRYLPKNECTSLFLATSLTIRNTVLEYLEFLLLFLSLSFLICCNFCCAASVTWHSVSNQASCFAALSLWTVENWQHLISSFQLPSVVYLILAAMRMR